MKTTQLARCIGCGCTDNRACRDQSRGEACHWLRLNRSGGTGVCSACKHKLPEWDGQDLAARAGVRIQVGPTDV